MDVLQNTLVQIHNGQTHIGEYLSFIFQNLPVSIFWKDLNSVYMGCNQHMVELFNRTDSDEITNKTDFDFCWNEKDAEFYVTCDQEIRTNNQPKFNIVEKVQHVDGTYTVMSTTKIPVYDVEKSFVGVAGFSIPISTGLANTAHYHLINMTHTFAKENNYYMLVNTQIIHLTARQAECLTHLSMGKTVKQIANMLGCANSTIEDHIGCLKRKLSVYSTDALINCFWENPIKWF